MPTAISTTSLIDSLGINTHLDFPGSYSNLAVVENAIEYLGLVNLRDSPGNSGDLSLWQQVAQATGVKFDAFVGETSPSGMSSELSTIAQLANEGILNLIEGGNEEDDAYPISVGNNQYIAAQFQQQVYGLGQQLGLPVINLSFGASWTAANNWLGDYGTVGDLSGITTYGNAHTYPGIGQTTDSVISRLNWLAKFAASSRPVITTEIGWDLSQGFSQAQVASYVLEAALDGMKDGDVKTYYYAMFNDQSGQFGLMSDDGSPTPAATALHNLTTLLGDTGGSFAPSTLNYTLTGSQGDNTLLMEKSDGSYWLSIWNESADAHSVTLSLGSAASQIQVFDPLTGTTAVQSAGNTNSITLTVPDHPVLVEIGGGNPPVTTPAPAPNPAPAPTLTPPPGGGADQTGTGTTGSNLSNVTIAANDSTPVETVSNTQLTASSGDHIIFIGGTGDVLSASGGTETVMAFQGGNQITTGSGNDTIRFAGANNVINAGGGQNVLQDSGSNGTIVLPSANQGYDNIYGWVLQNGDKLDLGQALAGTSWQHGDMASIGNFLKITPNGTGSDISIDPTGTPGGASYVIATLQAAGPVSLSTLLAHAMT